MERPIYSLEYRQGDRPWKPGDGPGSGWMTSVDRARVQQWKREAIAYWGTRDVIGPQPEFQIVRIIRERHDEDQ